MLHRIAHLLRTKEPVQEDRGLLIASGDTVPSDGADGYQTGCIFQHTDGGAETALYQNEGSVTSCAFKAVKSLETSELSDLSDVGTLAYTSGMMLVADGDSYEETDDIYLPKTGSFRLGDWVASAAVTGGKTFSSAMDIYSDGQLDVMQVHGAVAANLGSGYSAKCGRFRHVVNVAATVEQETYGLIGQVVVKSATLGHYHAGLMGTIESNGGFTVGNTAACSAGVIGRPGGASITVSASCHLAALAAVSNTSSITATGDYAGLLVMTASSGVTDRFQDGILIIGPDVTMGMRVGKFASSAATTSAVLFRTAQDVYSDGQLSTVEIHGASSGNLGSGYSAKCLRARHVVNATTAAHETYGAMGQLVVKSTTLSHLHAGVIGTFEGHTSGVTSTPAYRYGTSCVQARLGGGGAITASTPITGFSAVFNGAALSSGSSVAYAVTNTSTGEWDYVFGVTHAGSGVHNGVEIVDGVAGDTGSEGKVGYDALMKVDIGGTAYYIALFDAGSVTGEA